MIHIFLLNLCIKNYEIIHSEYLNLPNNTKNTITNSFVPTIHI